MSNSSFLFKFCSKLKNSQKDLVSKILLHFLCISGQTWAKWKTQDGCGYFRCRKFLASIDARCQIKFNRGIEKFGCRDAKWHPSNPSASKRPRCQNFLKSRHRAQNRSNTSTKRAQPNPADHQRDRPRTSKINKNRYSHDRKMIRPSFFIIF